MAATSGTLGIFNLHSVIAEAIAPSLRNLEDCKSELLGTATQLLRISRSSTQDIYGQFSETYSSQVINNCIIHYPLSKIQIFDTISNTENETNSIDLSEILPITLRIKFTGNNALEIVSIQPGDIFVDYLKDEHNNIIPIKMIVNNRAFGQFMDKYIISKEFELTLLRGSLQNDVQLIVDNYINSL